MGFKSEHDLFLQAARAKEFENLLNLYRDIAIERSKIDPDGYGFTNVLGQEVPSPVVLEPPVGYVPPPDIMQQVRDMVRRELSLAAAAVEAESEEDADDFDMEEIEPWSPYEEYFAPDDGSPKGPAADTDGQVARDGPNLGTRPDDRTGNSAPDVVDPPAAPPAAPSSPDAKPSKGAGKTP